jgi:threonine synthase
MSATGGAAVGGAESLADGPALGDDDVVVLVNPATANREADILRSHLMKQGV